MYVLPVLVSYVHRLKSAKVTDKRVRIMNEIISGIRVVKMYAWDYAFKKLIKQLRRFVILYYEQYLHCYSYMYDILPVLLLVQEGV